MTRRVTPTLGVRTRRIVSRGDLPGSAGGVYNPGAVMTDEGIVLLARREIDYRFTTVAHAERIVVDPKTLKVVSHRTLRRRGYADDARIEDFRLIRHGGELLAVHSLVRPDRIRPMLSRLGARTIEPCDPLDLPIKTARVEKNWVLFDVDGRLHCLYKLDPLTIFARGPGGRWKLVKREDNGWGAAFRSTLSNSTNLVPFDGGYLGFWHSIVDRRYVQGAMFLDRHLDLAFATGVLLDGATVRTGFKPGVLYVSSLVVHDGRVLAFYGEADTHTGVAIFDADALRRALRRHPFVPRPPLKVRLAPASMGQLFQAMGELEAIGAREARPLWVHLRDRTLHEAVSRFGVRGLELRDIGPRARVDHAFGTASDRGAAARKARRRRTG